MRKIGSYDVRAMRQQFCRWLPDSEAWLDAFTLFMWEKLDSQVHVELNIVVS